MSLNLVSLVFQFNLIFVTGHFGDPGLDKSPKYLLYQVYCNDLISHLKQDKLL